jgi:hypothetical protein
MRLRSEVMGEDIDEAHYLFEISTMKSIEGAEFGYFLPENVSEEVQKIEEMVRKRVTVGSQVLTAKLVEDLRLRHN